MISIELARRHSGEGAAADERLHRYAAADGHEYPAHALVEEVWAPQLDSTARTAALCNTSGIRLGRRSRRASGPTA